MPKESVRGAKASQHRGLRELKELDVDALEPAAVPGPSPLALCTDSQEGDKLEMEGKLGRGGAQWAWVQVPESG